MATVTTTAETVERPGTSLCAGGSDVFCGFFHLLTDARGAAWLITRAPAGWSATETLSSSLATHLLNFVLMPISYSKADNAAPPAPLTIGIHTAASQGNTALTAELLKCVPRPVRFGLPATR